MLKKTVGNIIRRSTRAGCVSLALTLSSVALLAGPPEKAPVIIDGKLTDRFWQGVTPVRLVPAEAQVPADLGGKARTMARRFLPRRRMCSKASPANRPSLLGT